MRRQAQGTIADRVEALLNAGSGILRLHPAWVARDFLPAGRRLNLAEDAYDVGERGEICERWLASTTPADNRIRVPDEGLSAIAAEDEAPLLLADAVRAAPELIMGRAYAAAHPRGLGWLAKIFDYADRLPYHIHPPQVWADRVGRRAKDEAYHFLPGAEPGAHPETFLGVHPHIANGPRGEALLPYLQDWDSDLILRTTRAYLQVSGEGFDVPSGVLHAPGTALTLELQEDSDVRSMFQALNAGKIISKELLFKDVLAADRAREAERAPLNFVDWERNGDPDLYARSHLAPVPVDGQPAWGTRDWVFSGSAKFSGQRVVVEPGHRARITEPGVYSVFAWSGSGRWGGVELTGGEPGRDEALVCSLAAIAGVEVINTGGEPMVAYLLSGPDLHPEAASIGGWG
jgi:hypothetical protein